MKVERAKSLSQKEFIENYLKPNKPVVVTEAMNDWPALKVWTPDYLSQKLGKYEVLVYNELFDLIGIRTLEEYLARNFGRNSDEACCEYVRWYSRLKHVEFVWADKAFEVLKKDWGHPDFLPLNGYSVPPCRSPSRCNATESRYPYRGIFISGRGARTRLHRDPWTTSAVLCQFQGKKKLTMFQPEQAMYLMNGKDFADLSAPDLQRFPGLQKARAVFEDVLCPGEILYIPSGWLHEIVSLSDSISVTWNFVHENRLDILLKYIQLNSSDSELEVLKYFCPEGVKYAEVRV